jgi:hypothetical protein
MAEPLGMAELSQTSLTLGMGRMAGTDYNGYKGWTDFIITLVVVNLNSLSFTQIVN